MEGLKPYPEYRESDHPWIDKIPAHWEEKRAKYLFREVDERSETGDEELLSVSHITGVTPRSQKNINMFLAESYIGSKLCQEGDLVINTMWAWMAALGVAKQSGIVSPSYGVYRPKSRDIFVNGYIDHLLRIKPYASEYFCRSTGIRSSRLRLYPESFLQIPILFPSYEEQILIVKFLRWINFQVRNYIQGKRKEIELLNEQKQVIIHQAVTRGLDLSVPIKDSGIDWLGAIPEHWEVSRFGYHTQLMNGINFLGGEKGYNYKMVGVGDFQDYFSLDLTAISTIFLSKKLVENELLKKDDLLFVRSNGNPKLVGRCILIGECNEEITFSGFTIRGRINSNRLYPGYIAYFLKSNSFKSHLEMNSYGTNITNMNQGILNSLPIPLPPYAQQKSIKEYLDSKLENLSNLISNISSTIEIIKEYRTRLITDIVTGKLDVRSIAATLSDIEEILIDESEEEEPEEEYTDDQEE